MHIFDEVKLTYIENWPDRLINHSVATVHFPLAGEQVKALLAYNYMSLKDGLRPSQDDENALKELTGTIDRYINQFPKGAFVCLGSRSPKDS